MVLTHNHSERHITFSECCSANRHEHHGKDYSRRVSNSVTGDYSLLITHCLWHDRGSASPQTRDSSYTSSTARKGLTGSSLDAASCFTGGKVLLYTRRFTPEGNSSTPARIIGSCPEGHPYVRPLTIKGNTSQPHKGWSGAGQSSFDAALA